MISLRYRTPTRSCYSRPTIASSSSLGQIMAHSRSPGVNYWRNKLSLRERLEKRSRTCGLIPLFFLLLQAVQRRIEELRLGRHGKGVGRLHARFCRAMHTRCHHLQANATASSKAADSCGAHKCSQVGATDKSRKSFSRLLVRLRLLYQPNGGGKKASE